MVVGSLFVEGFGLLLYIAAFYLACKIKKVDFLIYITIFALIFENLNVLLFHQASSGYVYTSDFFLYVFKTPLFVILDWAILVFGAYLLSLKLKMSKITRLFFIPLFVVIVDFVIEGISVSLGYWNWVGVSGGSGLFSLIPPSNFAGWIGVVFGFILCYEYLKPRWLSMFLGYFVFLGVAVVFITISKILGLVEPDNYITFCIVFFVFVFLFLHFYHENRILKKNRKELKVNFFYAKYII
jgi:uncharacterized membrane protein